MKEISKAVLDYFRSPSPEKFIKELKGIDKEEALYIMDRLGSKEVSRRMDVVKNNHYDKLKRKI